MPTLLMQAPAILLPVQAEQTSFCRACQALEAWQAPSVVPPAIYITRQTHRTQAARCRRDHATSSEVSSPRSRAQSRRRATNNAPSRDASPYPASPSTSTLHQSPPGPAAFLPNLASPSASATSSPAPVAKKAERPFRLRVKSLTSLSASRSKESMGDVPPVPAIPADFTSPEVETTRSVWEESPVMPPSSTFPSTPRSLGRLRWRKKAQEDVDTAFDNFVPFPPKMSNPQVADEAVPRSSMSSARGFDVADSSEPATNIAQTRTTIRKTLSPALLSEVRQPGLEATLADDELSMLGHTGKEDGDIGSLNEAIVDSSELHSEEEHSFRSPLGRFNRGHAAVDRLSRVEELSERLSYINDVNESDGIRPSSSMPLLLPSAHSPRSFGEHRSARRNLNGKKQTRRHHPRRLIWQG